jgi:formate hydrogenlyase subunit 3/multisubunit Na+/H+ antiporter MnhD subunit
MTWWAITVLGALAGGILIFLYEHWAVKRGFQAWSILEGNEEQVNTPSWRKLWWWILLSFVVLFIGLIAGVTLNKMLAG